MKKIIPLLKGNAGFILVIIVLFAFRSSIADWHPVPTGSMKPTILEGDIVWENKMAFDLNIPFTDITLLKMGEPNRGDIIVFTSIVADKTLIKRLVGLPGDTLEVKNNHLIINGEPALYEDKEEIKLAPLRLIDREKGGKYTVESLNDLRSHVIQTKEEGDNPFENFRELKIGEGQYFFMGDNRDDSADSRIYGLIDRADIKGRVNSTLLSVITKKSWSFWNWRIRSERILSSLE